MTRFAPLLALLALAACKTEWQPSQGYSYNPAFNNSLMAMGAGRNWSEGLAAASSVSAGYPIAVTGPVHTNCLKTLMGYNCTTY